MKKTLHAWMMDSHLESIYMTYVINVIYDFMFKKSKLTLDQSNRSYSQYTKYMYLHIQTRSD